MYPLPIKRVLQAPLASSITVVALFIAAIAGLCMHFNDYFPGVNVNQIGEWVAFYMDFFCRYNFAMIIKYRSEVVPSKTQ